MAWSPKRSATRTATSFSTKAIRGAKAGPPLARTSARAFRPASRLPDTICPRAETSWASIAFGSTTAGAVAAGLVAGAAGFAAGAVALATGAGAAALLGAGSGEVAALTAGTVFGGSAKTCGQAAPSASMPANTVSHTRFVFIAKTFLMRKTYRSTTPGRTPPRYALTLKNNHVRLALTSVQCFTVSSSVFPNPLSIATRSASQRCRSSAWSLAMLGMVLTVTQIQ